MKKIPIKSEKGKSQEKEIRTILLNEIDQSPVSDMTWEEIEELLRKHGAPIRGEEITHFLVYERKNVQRARLKEVRVIQNSANYKIYLAKICIRDPKSRFPLVEYSVSIDESSHTFRFSETDMAPALRRTVRGYFARHESPYTLIASSEKGSLGDRVFKQLI